MSETNTVRRFKSQAEWAKSFFEWNDTTKKFVCKLHHITQDKAGNVVKKRKCTKCFCASTNASNKVKHVCDDHALELPENLKEDVEDRKKQESLKKFFVAPTPLLSGTLTASSQQADIDKIALAYCMNPTVSFETMGNIYWLAAFGKVLEPVRGKENLKLAVKDLSRRVQKDVKNVLTGILPLQMDGGKDVNLRKLIASCVVVGRNALLFDLHDTELGVLSATYYRNLVKKNIKAIMEAKTCFVPAITVDNEASQNAGINEATYGVPVTTPDDEFDLKYLLHFRCGNHTAELIQVVVLFNSYFYYLCFVYSKRTITTHNYFFHILPRKISLWLSRF